MYLGTQPNNRPKSLRRSLLDIIRWGCGRRSRFLVRGQSMLPTLLEGHSVLYSPHTRPKENLIILFRHPNQDLILIKRCIKVEEDRFWVEGDNPQKSTDSRHFGWVPQNCFIGSVTSLL